MSHRRRDTLMRANGLGTGQSLDDRHSLRRKLIQKLVVLRELREPGLNMKDHTRSCGFRDRRPGFGSSEPSCHRGSHAPLRSTFFDRRPLWASCRRAVAPGAVLKPSAFTESGSVASLSGAEHTDSLNYSILGLRYAFLDMTLGDMNLMPRLDAGWQHALTRFVPGQSSTLVDPGQSFQVLGTPVAQDAAAIQAGFDLRMGSATLFIAYDGSFASTAESHAFHGGLNWRF